MYLILVTISNCIAITNFTRGSIFLCRYVEISKRIGLWCCSWVSTCTTGSLSFSPCGRVFMWWWWCPSHSRGTHYSQLLCSHCVKYRLGWKINFNICLIPFSVSSFSQNTSHKFCSHLGALLVRYFTNQSVEDKPSQMNPISFAIRKCKHASWCGSSSCWGRHFCKRM